MKGECFSIETTFLIISLHGLINFYRLITRFVIVVYYVLLFSSSHVGHFFDSVFMEREMSTPYSSNGYTLISFIDTIKDLSFL